MPVSELVCFEPRGAWLVPVSELVCFEPQLKTFSGINLDVHHFEGYAVFIGTEGIVEENLLFDN